MDLGKLWIGIGFETGGEIIVGTGFHQGAAFCYGDSLRTPTMTRYFSFEQRSVTVGLGLGGSGGATFIIGLNAAEPQTFAQPAEWSADFSLDMGIGGLAKYVRTAPEMVKLAAIGANFNRNGLALAEALTQYESNRRLVKDAADIIVKNHGAWLDTVSGSALICLPMPFSNFGLRFSVKAKHETTTVTPWGTFSFPGS